MRGIVPSDTWLTCRKKLMNNMKIQSARKATHTWLAGKIKCGNCGYALMSIYNPSGKQYLRCTKRLDNKSCPGCGKIITSELEAVVYQQMVKKLASYKTLTGKKKAAKANPKITALQVELAHVDSEIEKLVDSLTGANNVLFSYVNVKIAELDGRKQELLARIAELTVEAISPEQVSQISGYLDTWENVSFDDKRRVVDLMITTIAATSDSLNITWKNLTGGTPPVRYLPCVVPCKLYFALQKIQQKKISQKKVPKSGPVHGQHPNALSSRCVSIPKDGASEQRAVLKTGVQGQSPWCSFLHFSHEKWRPPAGIPPGRCAPRPAKGPDHL